MDLSVWNLIFAGLAIFGAGVSIGISYATIKFVRANRPTTRNPRS